ncbi:MAG: DUF4920 domain-containing protein [Chitinophagales bacterium]
MKNLLLFLFTISLLIACNNSPTPTSVDEETGYEYFGIEITEEDAISTEEFATLFAENEGDTIAVKVQGEVSAVCKQKGCWMTMDMGNENELFIKFKDYDFFVPLNCEGRTAIIEGNAYKEEISVDMLKHYAFDEGLPQEEIDAITEPEISYSFMADGVIIQ